MNIGNKKSLALEDGEMVARQKSSVNGHFRMDLFPVYGYNEINLIYMKSYRKSTHSWASRRGGSWRSHVEKIRKTIRRWDKKTLTKNIILGGIALFLAGTIFLLGSFAWLSRDLPDPNQLTLRDVPQSTKIYDASGEVLLYEISGGENRTLVPLEELPEYIGHAVITAEDRSFYEHNGIDFRGIARALFFNVVTLDATGQGASTITQQLVKNAILSNEQTYTRKIKEMILAFALERRYTKDEILQLYINEIPYGSVNYGIEAAAQDYYGKAASELSLAEAATLAALPQAPTTYINNPDRLKVRRDWVLTSMVELEYLTQEEADIALAEESPLQFEENEISGLHFVLWVKEQLEEEYGERMVEQGGLTVITTLDADMQLIAEEAVENNRVERSETYGFNNSGLVAMDPDNGHIVSMVGSADYFDDDIQGQVNVTMRPLQPGSSFKPIIYTAAFEAGYTPNTIVWDALTNFGTSTGTYTPNNYNLETIGPVTLRKALQGSLNIPAVKVLYLIGVESGLDFAERLGYSTFEDRSRFGLSIVLGGAEVELLEHVTAYSVFANEGTLYEPVSILSVEDADGEMLQEWEEVAGEDALDGKYARMITNVLSDNNARAYAFGTGSYLQLGSRPVAAKTGTTNDYNDAWTIGYTPSLVAGVWTGNTDGTQMNRGSGGSSVAAPIWNEFMYGALADQPVEFFSPAEIPVTGKSMLDGKIPAQTVTIDKASGKLATDRTPESYQEEVSCGDYHTILTYVDRGDPLGPAPKNPERDGAYTSWEAGVQAWLTEHNENLEDGEVALEICEIPTEEDDVHVKANEPRINIESPDNKDEVARSFTAEVTGFAPRGIDRIEYAIDGTVIETTSNQKKANLSLPSWVTAGTHTLTVTVYDDVDNSNTDDIKIDVTEGATTEIGYTISNPFNGQTIEKTAPTYTMTLESSNAGNIAMLEVIATNLWTGASVTIDTVSGPGSFQSVQWALGDVAEYQITARATTTDGEVIDSSPITVTLSETGGDTGIDLTEGEGGTDTDGAE
jgi:1A family penicillin-binding protein